MKTNYMVFILPIAFILISNMEAKCIKSTIAKQKCNIINNVKGDTEGLNYDLHSYETTNSIEECCQNCINLTFECTFFGYFDGSKLCFYFSGLSLNNLSLSPSNGTSFGAPSS